MELTRKIITFSFFIFAAVGVIGPVNAVTWFEYRSKNFILYSDVSQRKAKKVVRQLERFRYGALKFTGKENHPENSPVTFLYFGKRDDIGKLTGPERKNVLGYFVETWDGPLLVGWSSNWSLSGKNVAYHEYVHHLMRNHDHLRYPRWYEEGFAELLSSAQLRGDSMAIGHAPEWRLYALGERGSGRVSLRDLLNPNFLQTKDNANEFYAESWLLTHYLLLGELSGNKSYREASAKYILDLANGGNPFESFEKNMEMSIEEVSNELRRYKNDDRLKGIRVSLEDLDVEISHRKIPLNEALKILAIRALDHYKDDAGEAFLSKTDRSKTGWEVNALLSTLFSLHEASSSEPNMDSSNEASDSAKLDELPLELPNKLKATLEKLAQSDYEVAGLLGHYYYDLASYLGVDHHRHPWLNTRSIEFSQMATTQKPESLRAYEYLWRAQNREGHKVDAFRTMMAAYKYHPNHLNLNYSISDHLISLERLDLAEPFLVKISDISHNERRVRWARDLLVEPEKERAEN